MEETRTVQPRRATQEHRGSRLTPTVFLLLLCNDKAVLGPWVNSKALNLFTGAVVAVLVMLSIILTASVLFPDMDAQWMIAILVGGSILGLLMTVDANFNEWSQMPIMARPKPATQKANVYNNWRMPPLDTLPPAKLSLTSRVWMIVLRGYLVLAGGLVLVRIFQLAIAGA
jgi:hypothetical protein